MLGDRLKELRRKRNVTQDEMAKVVGMTRTAIAKYESNERVPDLETLVKISDYFGVSLDYLCSRKQTYNESIAYKMIELLEQRDLVSRIEGTDINTAKSILEVVINLLDEVNNLSNKQ